MLHRGSCESSREVALCAREEAVLFGVFRCSVQQTCNRRLFVVLGV